MSTLTSIQRELKAPKNRKNSFGGYNYRSLEDILEAVKPLLAKYGATLRIWDEVECHGSRVYVVANAILTTDDGEYSAKGYAREAESKKGMDDSQTTGTASSYARKYALNGLFLIDDTKDADTDEYQNEQEARLQKLKKTPIGEARAIAVKMRCENDGIDLDEFMKLLKVKSLDRITEEQLSWLNLNWKAVKEKYGSTGQA